MGCAQSSPESGKKAEPSVGLAEEKSGAKADAPAQVEVGGRARIFGLVARKDLNDTECDVLEWVPDQQRWNVRVGDETAQLKSDNLEPVAHEEADDDSRTLTGPSDMPDERRISSSSTPDFSIDATGEVTDLQDCGLVDMPEWAVESEELLPLVKILWLDRNRFTDLPRELGKCVQLDKLNMYNNKLTRLAQGVLPRSLRILELNHNQLVDIGKGVFSGLPHLRHLDLCAIALQASAPPRPARHSTTPPHAAHAS